MKKHQFYSMLVGSLIFFGGNCAHAFGMFDVVGVGVKAGSKIGGALIDKAFDSLKDPEKEKKKKQAERDKQEKELLAQVQKGLDAIESRKDLTSLDRERLKLTYIDVAAAGAALAAFFDAMEEREELARKAEVDRLLTPSGVLTTVVEASADSSGRGAQSDFRSQLRAASSRTPTQRLYSALEQANGIGNAGHQLARVREKSIEDMAPHAAQAQAVGDSTKAKILAAMPQVPDSFFAQDQGKKIYVEYVDSDTETKRLRDTLRAQGYSLAGSRAEAEAYYRIEGLYLVTSSPVNKELMVSSGSALAKPEMVPLPEPKEPGVLHTAVSGLLSALAKPAQAADSKTAANTGPKYRQHALVVATRNPGTDNEIRQSARSTYTSPKLMAVEMVELANDLLYEKLGLIKDDEAALDPERSSAAKREDGS